MRALDEDLAEEEEGSHSHSSGSSSRISSPLSLPASIDDDHHFSQRLRHDNGQRQDELYDSTESLDLEAQIAVLEAQQREEERERARLQEQVQQQTPQQPPVSKPGDAVHALRANDLEIPEAQLQTLQQRNPDTLAWLEHVQLVAHTWALPRTQDLAQTQMQLQDSQRRVVGLSDQLEFHVQENERFAQETAMLRAQAQASAKELQEAQAKLQHQAHKERAHDDVATRLAAAEKKNAELQTQTTQQAAALTQATAAQDAMQRRVAEAAHCQDMLELDKAFLSKELETMKTAYNATQHALQLAEAKVQNLSLASEDWSQRLQQVKEEAQRAYEARLGAERCRILAEQAGTRTTSQEVWERETAMLREARQEALLQADRSRQELQALQQAHEDMVLRLAKQDSTAQATMAALRAEAKCKAFELARVEVLLEEKSQALGLAQEMSSALQAQCHDRRDVCVRLEARVAQKENELKLALEKVHSYEVLETQLDAAVTSFRTGGRMTGMGSGMEKPWIGSMPRRMQHAILLATRLRDRDEELALARREQQRVSEEVEGLRRHVVELQQLLHESSQPGRYVVELLREKDREVEGVRQQLRLVKTRVDEAQAQVQRLQREKERERERETMLRRRWHCREGEQGDREGEEEGEGRRKLKQRLAKHLLLMTTPPPCGSSSRGPRWHMKR